MIGHKKEIFSLVCLLLCFAITLMQAQNESFEAFKYQGVARTKSGKPIINQTINIKTGIYSGSPNGHLEWEETFSAVTNADGVFTCDVGKGKSTGNGNAVSFSVIQWQLANYYLKVSVDYSGGNNYSIMGTAELRTVPYAFYASSTGNVKLTLNELSNIDTNGIQANTVLKYNGTNWTPKVLTWNDSVSYAEKSIHSLTSTTTLISQTSEYSKLSDTASLALQFAPYNWSVIGNTGYAGKFLGTYFNEDLVFKTTAMERLRLQISGKVGVAVTVPVAQLHVNGNDGLLLTGAVGAGIVPDSAYNTRFMWLPGKSAFRVGQINSGNWNYNNIGNYSFAAGYNTKASGLYSQAFGYNCLALNENCISMGKNCSTDIVNGVIVNGGSLAFGDSCSVTITRSVAMGYKVINNGGLGFGYQVKVSGGGSAAAFGDHTNCAGINSIVLGHYASDNGKTTSFVFADQSGDKVTSNTANNQFMVRASGGIIFYSSSTLDNGVLLYPGGGAWASTCDVHKKENFMKEDPENILEKVMQLKVYSWNYKSQSSQIRHAGPMAQDFYKAFFYGESKKMISTIDIDGVNLAAIKALEKRTKLLVIRCKEINIDDMKSEVTSLDNFNDIKNRLNKLEQTLGIH